MTDPEERLERAREEGRKVAVIYCRMSLATMGDRTKVEDQERQCREVCRTRGWKVAEVYTDNSVSAWKRGVSRPGWDSMLKGIAAGRFSAVVSYWGDRLVRQPRDLEDLLDLRDVRQITVASIMGQYDFDNPDHRMMMRWEVARACNESDTISRRMTGSIQRRKHAGVVNSGGRGGRLFGFEKDGVTHHPAEAEIVREVFARFLAGDSIRGLAAGLRSRGVTTTAGKPVHPLAVRRMITGPRYAGLMPDGVSAGTWKPVVSREDWEAARAALDGRAAPPGPGHTARRYLLSGIARCGACSAPLQALPAYTSKWKGKPVRVAATYSCIQPGCRKVTRSVSLLDAYVTGRTVGRLANTANPEGHLPSVPALAVEWRQLADERAATEALAADPSKGRHVHLLLARLDSLDARLAELRELARGDADARLRGTRAGITLEEFAGEPLGVRRALVSACYEVTVLPASRRGPGFRTQDVRMVARVGGDGPGGEGTDGVRAADPGADRDGDADDGEMPGETTAAPVAGGDAGGLP